MYSLQNRLNQKNWELIFGRARLSINDVTSIER